MTSGTILKDLIQVTLTGGIMAAAIAVHRNINRSFVLCAIKTKLL